MDENIYRIEPMTKICFWIEGFLGVLAMCYLFYESLWAAIFLCPLIYVIYKKKMNQKMEELHWKLNLSFRDALAGMTAALSAGYSIENSVGEALVDLLCIYEKEDLIVKEFQRMNQEIKLNATIEQTFFGFARRSGLEDVLNFAYILYTAKRTGGDLLKITRTTSNMISERIEVNREIQTVVAAKRLECNVMSLVPAGIIIYLKVCCVGFLNPLYGNLAGNLIMTLVLIVYVLAYLAASRIVHIQV